MDVYHCLVTTRPGAVPELRDLSCESEAEISAAVLLAVREWRSVELVEVFRNGEATATYSRDQLSPGADLGATASPAAAT
ncbi:hypothetical protein ACO2Q1_01830 [Brevundimonas sp. VNH65]|uniref:hypothetical protein n=1 Tax=Brevundimonas sp. VNH65 TaxID=3400917 RepID=UPI003BFC2E63